MRPGSALQCGQDQRSNKDGGILVSDFTISGTQTISATDLASITNGMIGSCFDEDSQEMAERVRAAFQERGYFKVEVKSLRIKPRDPLGVPKPVTLEGEVSDGPQYRVGEVKIVNNHAFSAEELRQLFPLKKGAIFERGKVASGLESLRKSYATQGYLDFSCIPETIFGSNGTSNLTVTVEEGPQYHMGKLDITGNKQLAARLHANWKLSEGSTYDGAYVNEFIESNSDLLPQGFAGSSVQTGRNCPDAQVDVRMILDTTEDSIAAPLTNVPCEKAHENTKDSNNN